MTQDGRVPSRRGNLPSGPLGSPVSPARPHGAGLRPDRAPVRGRPYLLAAPSRLAVAPYPEKLMSVSVRFEKFPGMGSDTARTMEIRWGGSRASRSRQARSRSLQSPNADRRLQSGLVARAALVSAAVLMGGCSASGASPTSASSSTTSSTAASPRQQVLSAWAAAQQAIAAAEVHNDPNWPALFQTMVNPELAHVQAVIQIAGQQHYRVSGDFRVIKAQVSSYSPTRATVAGCAFDGVIAYQPNGQPVPGNAGTATYAVQQAVMVPAGSGWALEDATVTQYGTAQQAGPLCVG